MQEISYLIINAVDQHFLATLCATCQEVVC